MFSKPLLRTRRNMTFNQTSAEYIASLETKLSRLKGKAGKEPTSKDMLKSLEAVRADVNTRLSLPDDQNDACQNENSSLDTETVFSRIQQKLNPEGVALNTDELLKLIENDELQKNLSNT